MSLHLVLRARPFTDSCPLGRKGLVTCAHSFGDFPHDSWGTVLPSVLLIGSCVFFLHFRNLLTHIAQDLELEREMKIYIHDDLASSLGFNLKTEQEESIF